MVEKKTEKPPQIKLLEGMQVLPDSVTGKLNGFDINLKSNGEAEARRTYKNVKATISSEKEGKLLERQVILPRVEITMSFWIGLSETDIVSNKDICAKFNLEGTEYDITGEQ